MIAAAYIGILLGELALTLDLGGRLYGAYIRTPAGALARMLLHIFVLGLLASPILWVSIDPEHGVARSLVYVAGLVGVVVFVHYLFPYRWGIERISRRPATTIMLADSGLQLREEVVELASLPDSACGITCVVLSDLHCNTLRDFAVLEDSAIHLSAMENDFVFALGDFGENQALLPNVIECVSSISSRYGVYCVLGNHDYEGGREPLIRELMAQASIRALSNEACYLDEPRISLIGLDRPWRVEHPEIDAPDGFVIGLAHSPDNLLLFSRLNVAIGFAGHTHGGKLRIPRFGAALNPSKLGRFLDVGWFRFGGSMLYITPGVGHFPGRYGQMGEIFRFTLRKASATAES